VGGGRGRRGSGAMGNRVSSRQMSRGMRSVGRGSSNAMSGGSRGSNSMGMGMGGGGSSSSSSSSSRLVAGAMGAGAATEAEQRSEGVGWQCNEQEQE